MKILDGQSNNVSTLPTRFVQFCQYCTAVWVQGVEIVRFGKLKGINALRLKFWYAR